MAFKLKKLIHFEWKPRTRRSAIGQEDHMVNGARKREEDEEGR